MNFKKLSTSIVATAIALANPVTVFAQDYQVPDADTSVLSTPEFQRVYSIAGLVLGILGGIAVIVSVALLIINGIKLQTAGDDPQKQTAAKNGIKNTLIGLAISLFAGTLISLVLFVMKSV